MNRFRKRPTLGACISRYSWFYAQLRARAVRRWRSSRGWWWWWRASVLILLLRNLRDTRFITFTPKGNFVTVESHSSKFCCLTVIFKYIFSILDMLPLSLLKTAVNHPMLVELKNGETYNGHLVQCDNWMNLQLRVSFILQNQTRLMLVMLLRNIKLKLFLGSNLYVARWRSFLADE